MTSQTPLSISDIERLQAELALGRSREALLQEKVNHYEQENSRLAELLKSLKRQVFGKKSEHWEDVPDVQLGLFNEVEVAAVEGKNEQETQVISYTRKKGHGGRKPLPEDLPREDVIVELPEDQRFCPHDGHPLHVIGEEVSEKLKVVPAQFVVVRTTCKKYGCRACESHVRQASKPETVLPKTIATPELLSFIINAKFGQAQPLYRIEEFFNHNGVDLSRTTFARWLIQLIPMLMPVWNVLEEWVLGSGYVAIDATHTQVLKEKGRLAESKSSMWARGSPELGIILFDYDPSGSGYVAERLLMDYRGLLQSDQHKGYERFNTNLRIIRFGCMAHARRRFFAADADGAKAGKTLAKEGMRLIRRLYDVEADAKGKPPDERLCLRQEKSIPTLAEFKSWADTTHGKVPPKSLIGNAMNYVIEQWPYLSRYAEHGRVEIDNNWLERQLRYFAIGRRNWLFSDTVEGAKASALLYSLVVTAKINGKNPYKALLDVLAGLPGAKTIDDFEQLATCFLRKPVKQ